MNKTDLIDFMASSAGVSKNAASQCLEAFTLGVTNALIAGDSVTLVGFGKFVVNKRKERDGRNPKTGETIRIKASKTPGFKAGKLLKDSVNHKSEGA